MIQSKQIVEWQEQARTETRAPSCWNDIGLPLQTQTRVQEAFGKNSF